jgi:hypothetical protein
MPSVLSIYRRWASRDPEAALAHASQPGRERPGELQQAALLGVIAGWSTKDRKAALAYLDEHAGECLGDAGFMDTLFAIMAVPSLLWMEFPEMLDLALSFRDERCRAGFLGVASEITARYDAPAALRDLMARPPFEEKETILQDIVYQIPEPLPRPGETAAVLAAKPEGFPALSDLVSSWLEQAPEAALDWLDAQPRNEAMDHARFAAVAHLAGDNADKARGYLEGITDPDLKKEASHRLEPEPEPPPVP